MHSGAFELACNLFEWVVEPLAHVWDVIEATRRSAGTDALATHDPRQAPRVVRRGLARVPDGWLTVREAKQLLGQRGLGMSTATLVDVIERGELSHLRAHDGIRIEPAALEAFVAARGR